MSSLIKVKIVKFDNGERFPILMEKDGGIPLFKPTVYEITMIRTKNVSSSTIYRNLQAIMHLYTWACYCEIDLEQRFAKGEFLNINEIDSLTNALGDRYDRYSKFIESMSGQQLVRSPISPPLEKFRKLAKGNDFEVDSATKAIRLRYVRNYLDWLALHYSKRKSITSNDYSALDVARQFMKDSLEARLPTVRNLSFFGKREGLSRETEKRLREVIDPKSTENPWRDMNVRIRNRLFILSSLILGVRRGELLLTRVDDVNFQEGSILIRRSPDDPTDPRINQPNAKTRDRILPLDDDLAQLLYDYVVRVRGKISAARRHSFLFVAINSGAPLSMASVTKMFITLRQRVPDMPNELTGHVLRHTWNDRFSEMMDKNKVPEEEEKKLRSYLMGWSETSGSAATYTRRHIRKKSNEVSLKLQRQLIKEDNYEKDAPK